MYKVIIQNGWTERCFEGETATDIMDQFWGVQNFTCLLQMGRMEEDEDGQKELDKLETFLSKYYDGQLTIDDIKTLNISLSIGEIKCLKVTEE